MPRPSRAVVALIALLLLSNAAWLYNSIDAGVSYTYRDASARLAEGAFLQCSAVVKASAQPGATRDSIISAARELDKGAEPFEKDGYLWVGYTGLRFDDAGRLVEVASLDEGPP